MDPSRFDRLSRGLATAANRRAALVAVVLGLLPFIELADDSDARTKKEHRTKRGRRDSRNGANRDGDRGRSGNRRRSRHQQNEAQAEKKRKKKKKKPPKSPPAPPASPPPGGSPPPPPPLTCQGGLTPCGLNCVDTATDPANCGGCGAACSPDQTCTGGQCTCNGAACEGCCDGATCQAGTSPQQCGANGAACKVCGGGRTCENGSCVCPDGKLFCDGACIDKQTDERHCGACGLECEPGEVCQFGLCGVTCGANDFCPYFSSESTCCAGECVDTSNRTAHCGACDNDCRDHHASICISGSCSCGFTGAPCRADQTCCRFGQGLEADCRDTQTDVHNCGVCDRDCGIESDRCHQGSCKCVNDPPCISGYTCCGNQACFNLQVNQNHCGACWNACEGGSLCIDGVCQCGSGGSCPAGQTCCGSGCIDLKTDRNNCGFCGFPCALGQTCCNGRCTDIRTDIDNCRTCGNACPGDRNSTTSNVACYLAECTITCRGQNYDLNGDISDGCEREDTQTNHTQETALDLGALDCLDSIRWRFSGTIFSDTRPHVNHPNWDSAPLWYKVRATHNPVCVNDPGVVLTMDEPGSACYLLEVITDKKRVFAPIVDGQAVVDMPPASFSDGSTIYFLVSKACGEPRREAKSFSAEFHL